MAELESDPRISGGDDDLLRVAMEMTAANAEHLEDEEEEKPEGEIPEGDAPVDAESAPESDVADDNDEADGEAKKAADEGEEKAEADEAEDDAEEDNTPDWDKEDDDEALAAAGGQYASPKAKVKMPDGSEATISSLMEGAMRNEDYTQKSQAVAQQRQQVEQMAQVYQQKEQQLEQTLTLAYQVLQSQIPPEPTAEMRREDPLAYMDAKASHDEAIGRLQAFTQALNARQQNMTQQQQQEYQQRLQMHQRTELDALLMKMPSLRDPKKAEQFIGDAQKAAQYYGFSQQEFQLNDHRYALMLADAIRHRRVAENAKSAVRGKATTNPKRPAQSQAPVMKAGKRAAPVVAISAEIKQAEERLKQTGDMQDAAYLMTLKQRAARRQQ